MQKITPCLWFATQAEDAARFYVSLFRNSQIRQVSRYGEGGPVPAGTALMVDFELDGVALQALNGARDAPFTEAISLSITADTQQEIDELWEALTADGGEAGQCGWLRDRFGVSWQVVPPILGELLTDPDREKADRVMQAMLAMTKIEIPALRAAYAGQ